MASPAATTTYYVTLTSATNCSQLDSVVVTVNPVPVVELGNNFTLCSGDAATLDATYPGATYTWSTGATAPSINVSTANTYSVVLDLNGCTATDAVTVSVLDLAAYVNHLKDACGVERVVCASLGLREHAEVHDLAEVLAKVGLDLVAPLQLFIPVYRGARRPKWQIGVGLALLAGVLGYQVTRSLGAGEKGAAMVIEDGVSFLTGP